MSGAVDRFICRREGHVPSVTITLNQAATGPGATYGCNCRRCGKFAEFPMPPFAVPVGVLPEEPA